jgi:hypothetical protein
MWMIQCYQQSKMTLTATHSRMLARYLGRAQSQNNSVQRVLVSGFPSNNHPATVSHPYRSFSSNVGSPTKQKEGDKGKEKTAKEKNDNNDDFMLMYHRNSSRNTAHRAFFGVSVFNTVYWLWYTLDFVPAVNASPIEDLHIDPAVGIGGFALGLMINSLTVLYPISSISRLSYSPTQEKWRLWGHSLPLLGPSMGQPKEFPLGDLTTDRGSADTKKVLKNGIEAFSGHLGIAVKGAKFPYLMEIKEPTELPGDNELLLQALLNPGLLADSKKNLRKNERRGKNKKRRKRTK